MYIAFGDGRIKKKKKRNRDFTITHCLAKTPWRKPAQIPSLATSVLAPAIFSSFLRLPWSSSVVFVPDHKLNVLISNWQAWDPLNNSRANLQWEWSFYSQVQHVEPTGDPLHVMIWHSKPFWKNSSVYAWTRINSCLSSKACLLLIWLIFEQRKYRNKLLRP